MRHLLSASILAIAAFGLPGAANAYSVSYDSLPANGSYFAPHATSSTEPYFEHVAGSDSTRTSPFSDTSTFYDSVGANGSATFGNPLPTESEDFVSLAAVNGPSSSGFGTGSGTFTFVWGTPDTYNYLDFYNNGSFLGTAQGSGNGSGSYLATVSGLGDYNTVVFRSVGQNAFEFAAVSPVPLPASLPMFGAAVLALGGLGLALRGRSAARAPIAG